MEAFLLIALVSFLYFLPGIVASSRSHHQAVAIFVLNIFLGWTFVGWVVALVWACTAIRMNAANVAVVAVATPAPTIPERSTRNPTSTSHWAAIATGIAACVLVGIYAGTYSSRTQPSKPAEQAATIPIAPPTASLTAASLTTGSVAKTTPSPAAEVFYMDEVSQISLTKAEWHKAVGGNIAVISALTIENKGKHSRRDLVLVCDFKGASGTIMSTTERVLYDVVPSKGRKTFRDINFGFVSKQADSLSCRVKSAMY